MATTEQVQRALVRIKELQAEVAERQEAIDYHKAFVAENLPDGESTIDNFRVSVYTYKKYDEAYGKRNAPELWDKYAEQRLVLDSKTAKAKMSDEEYAQFQKPSGGKTVKVEVTDD